MVLVKSVKPITDGWLFVTFDNGEQKFVDINPHMNGILKKLKDPEFFKQVFIDPELDTVSWPGELDLDPDNLYKQGINTDIIKNLSKSLTVENTASKITYDQNNQRERA
ncbi:DUF2442 domain-containing protein [Metabacillus halosaccharovorans]|uniref:DUF2442 domain-containing protein n=1 Tax=Metabacillus halosaccharovorans TaxID=930124 RepID=UPI0020425C36|nr:DUF2442 domain-containing protein [Metabacillus halosaccharovorans]MCM3439415.1 DUF2442 domain-containing protein [Metabacillus halosaccharovorans]